MTDEVTNGRVVWTVNRDTLVTLVTIVLAAGVTWGTLTSELAANEQQDDELKRQVEINAKRTSDRLDGINRDLTDIKVKQGEQGADIQAIKERVDQILKQIDRVGNTGAGKPYDHT